MPLLGSPGIPSLSHRAPDAAIILGATNSGSLGVNMRDCLRRRSDVSCARIEAPK
jgi:hypothetical protein